MKYEATAPLGYVALADVLQAKFGKFNAEGPGGVQAERAEKMKNYLRAARTTRSSRTRWVTPSALRHNFVSSSDAWNYRPQYWQLRTNAKTRHDGACDDAATVGDGAAASARAGSTRSRRTSRRT